MKDTELKIKNDMINKLQAENEKLRECVEFYGNENNWMSVINGKYNLGHIWVERNDTLASSITTENGKRARQCLKELEGGEC